MCVCVCVYQERLESLVFGLLRQRKLDFLDIYKEEMTQAAKGIVTQVRSPPHRGAPPTTEGPHCPADPWAGPLGGVTLCPLTMESPPVLKSTLEIEI